MIEKSIIQSEKVFRELFDNMSSGVAVYESVNGGEDFIIKDLNKAGENISQVNQKEIIGKIVTDIFPGIKKIGLFKVLQRVWTTGKSEHHPISQYKDQRITQWVENYVYKLPSGLIVAIFDDVSEQKEAEKALKESEDKLKQLNKELEQLVEDRTKELKVSEEKYSNLFQHSNDGIFFHNFEGNIIDANQKVLEQFGYEKDEILALDVPQLHPISELEKSKKAFIEISKKGFVRFEITFKKKNGEEFPAEVSSSLFTLGGEKFIQGVVRDITTRKQSESRLKESEEKYRKAYYQANLYRDIFAHDINNILQNINSSAELSSLYLNNPEKLHTISELYEIIREQVERGTKLIKNVRKINEIDESEAELEKIEAIKFLKNAITFLKNSFQARTLDVKIDGLEKTVFVLANNLLLDVFENILINAVRHNISPKIEIDIEISKENVGEKNYIRMEFKDNGIGISDYRKKSIFEKGTRKSKKSKGMGLGLSLVKKIVDSYRGDIWVEDRVKGAYKLGSNFVILLQEA